MKVFSTKLCINKAVILTGEEEIKLAPLTNYCLPWMFPILSKPLMEYTISCLKENGIEEVIIALKENTEIPDYFKDKITGINIRFYKKDRPRGTAGTLRDLEKFIGNKPFLVIHGNFFAGHLDLEGLINFHKETDSIITVGVHKETNKNGHVDNISITENWTVKSFYSIHSSVDRRSPWKPSGIYLMNPSVLRFIDSKNYMDIKEQLIPALQDKGFNISAYETKGFYSCINNMSDYINVHRELLFNGFSSYLENKEEIVKRVWAGKNVKISPNA
jgi:mannose-1-phosphate guanylyltransferase/phosphomannomutase